jgi:3-oxoacyl-[acyl-carrier-protein] synthase-3
MTSENVYLSTPSIKLAQKKVTNDDIIELVKSNFKGSKIEFKKITSGINYIFNYCDSKTRFRGMNGDKKPIDYAVDASLECCKNNSVDISEVDVLIYGGIYREYFEPATAMEIANKIGIKKIYAFDVTNACAGLLQSVIVGYSLMKTNKNIRKIICCTTDFPDDAIDFDIQKFEELAEKGAGLTLGSAASAWILSRDAFENGCLRIVETSNASFPETYDICKVPISNKKFTSLSKKIFDLGVEHIPSEIAEIVEKSGWKLDEVNHFVSHQPGKKIIEKVCGKLKVDVKKAAVIHHLFGNTVNSTLPMTIDFLNNSNQLKNNDKVVMNTAAAGFTVVTIAGVWNV